MVPHPPPPPNGPCQKEEEHLLGWFERDGKKRRICPGWFILGMKDRVRAESREMGERERERERDQSGIVEQGLLCQMEELTIGLRKSQKGIHASQL